MSAKTGREGFARSGTPRPCPRTHPKATHSRPAILTVTDGLRPRSPHLTWRLTLVANRALAPGDHKSKLASLTWLPSVSLPGVGDLGTDPNVCYRAMDFLLEVEDQLAESVYWATADLLDLEVDLLLFDYPANPESGSALALAA